MKKLLNTLYISTPDYYLSLDGENIVVLLENETAARVTLHNLEAIVTCGYKGVSPALLGKCAERGISVCFLKPTGKFLARVSGEQRGNVFLRKTQYRISDNDEDSLMFAKSFITGKIYNSRWVIERAVRDHSLRLDVDKLKNVSSEIKDSLMKVDTCSSSSELLGIEGETALRYFSVFDDLILQQKEDFKFITRNRRPPLDNVNAMLSLSYTLLASMCAAALETVGLDPYVGFFHTDRPGRKSLALDLMEELRSVFADRFVLSLINKKIISPAMFEKAESGAVILTENGRKLFFTEWQKRKKEVITHPFLKEKVEWGMVPYTQALLLARTLRGDLDAYPPFMWK